MNDKHHPPANDPLRQALREWRVEASPPPRFAEGVWRRIERQERESESPWSALAGWFAHWLARPAFASVFLAAVLGAGLAAGIHQAQDKVEQASVEQRAQYLRTVNPYFVSAPDLPSP